MLELLKPFIDRIMEPKREATVELAGRKFLYDDAGKKYGAVDEKDNNLHAPGVVLADCASLIDWCRRIAADPDDDGQVVISRTTETVAQSPIWENGHVAREIAHKEFFMGFMPGERFEVSMSYIEMLTWLELLGKRLEACDVIEHALKTVAATQSNGVKIETDGAVIQVSGQNENRVNLSAKLSKRIEARIPFGDPGCEIDVTFGLQVRASRESAVVFTVRHLTSDGAFDAYVQWMRVQLAALPPGWLVLVGP